MKNYPLILFTLLTLLLGACSVSQPATPSAAPGVPAILATTSFLADLAQNVAGDRLQVQTLIPLGMDPHEYEPTPQDVARLSNSQVLIVNGIGYEFWLQKTLDGVGGSRQIITATAGMTPLSDPSGTEAAGDPHMWLDVSKTVKYVENIRDGLTLADPAGKDVYAQNANAYIAKLSQLDQWIKDQVSQIPADKRLLVTNHDALGYFSKAYGFTVVGAVIPSVTTDASPSAQQMANLIQLIKSSGAPAIFVETGVNTQLADQIGLETHIKVVTDLYLETLSEANGPAPDYIDMMKYDVTQIVDSLK
jgi:ABC-type Zn uptake system ZnuABC Zn-binding protein ZnuA